MGCPPASRLNSINVEINDLYSATDARAELDALIPDIEAALEFADDAGGHPRSHAKQNVWVTRRSYWWEERQTT